MMAELRMAGRVFEKDRYRCEGFVISAGAVFAACWCDSFGEDAKDREGVYGGVGLGW